MNGDTIMHELLCNFEQDNSICSWRVAAKDNEMLMIPNTLISNANQNSVALIEQFPHFSTDEESTQSTTSNIYIPKPATRLGRGGGWVKLYMKDHFHIHKTTKGYSGFLFVTTLFLIYFGEGERNTTLQLRSFKDCKFKSKFAIPSGCDQDNSKTIYLRKLKLNDKFKIIKGSSQLILIQIGPVRKEPRPNTPKTICRKRNNHNYLKLFILES